MKLKPIFVLAILCMCFSACQTLPEKGNGPGGTGIDKPREIYATDVSFDASTGKIIYTIPEDALVRIRIGISEGGPLLRTFLDWDERTRGTHEEVWDGKDASGLLNLMNRKDLKLALMCIAKGQREFKGYRKTPRFRISFPGSTSMNAQNVPEISDVAAVRISLDANDKKWLTESKYELKMFIDNVFLMEDEEGMDPFTYRLDTRSITNGVHTITINLAVYDGEVGPFSAPVFINNKAK